MAANDVIRVTLSALPRTADELRALPEYSLQDPCKVAALCVAALCAYPESRGNALDMLNALKGPRPLSALETQFIRDRFMDGKDYVPRSYFAGAVPGNDYAPTLPLTVTVQETPYSRDQEGYLQLYLTSGGADHPRPVTLRLKPSTGEWFLWEFSGLLAGIREPVSKDPWA